VRLAVRPIDFTGKAFLRAKLHAAADEAAVAAALGEIKAFLAPVSAGGHRPPSDPGQPLTLDQQIAEASQAGNTALAMRLKAQKLAG
jgi:hypothetical protein